MQSLKIGCCWSRVVRSLSITSFMSLTQGFCREFALAVQNFREYGSISGVPLSANRLIRRLVLTNTLVSLERLCRPEEDVMRVTSQGVISHNGKKLGAPRSLGEGDGRSEVSYHDRPLWRTHPIASP